MKIEEITQSVCNMAIDFQNKGNVSMRELFTNSGYINIEEKPNEKHFEQCLNNNSDLIQSWLDNSMNTRGSSSWYITENSNTEWLVGFYPNGKEQVFKNLNKACAFYINNYAKQLYDLSKSS